MEHQKTEKDAALKRLQIELYLMKLKDTLIAKDAIPCLAIINLTDGGVNNWELIAMADMPIMDILSVMKSLISSVELSLNKEPGERGALDPGFVS